MPNLSDTYLFAGNAVFIEELYQKYLQDPSSIDPQWQQYFAAMGESQNEAKRAFAAASWRPNQNKIIGYVSKEELAAQIKGKAAAGGVSEELLQRSLIAVEMLDAFRNYGHIEIQYDPLGIAKVEHFHSLHHDHYGLGEQDLDKEIYLGGALGLERSTIREMERILRQTYAGRLGFEYAHIESEAEREWFQEKVEQSRGLFSLQPEQKKEALFDLIETEMFESFAHTKFPGTKRFSIEGGEATIPILKAAIQRSVEYSVREVIVGMAHRGRLNTLTKLMQKPYHAMFSEFKGELAYPSELGIPGDVKYHLGASCDLEIAGQKVHMSLTPNPSHLEVVNSVVLGKVRAKQDKYQDANREQVMAVLIHGDAAFAGQGSVPEALYLSGLNAYKVGGTFHVVINNQIGFTTTPADARSSRYCTDVAKSISAPVIHVSGDDVEAAIWAANLAAEYRSQFKKDVVIDLVCYRKYGHNEGDEPFFTQPVMYSAITQHRTPDALYAKQLEAEMVIAADTYQAYRDQFKAKLEAEFQLSQSYKPKTADWLKGEWIKMKDSRTQDTDAKTGVKLETLKKIGKKLCEYPKDFNINPKIAKQLQGKLETIEKGVDLEWGTGEALAYGSLLLEGYGVRMSGQDCERGTFSHRHAVLVDQQNEAKYTMLNHIDPQQKTKAEFYNSNLSEFAVMGFEYGYSMTNPNILPIWEAQFGDFANGAQVIIDQYIASGEAKWLRMSGLVLLLPHGYEGNGPEHSSARLERFLQLCAADNMQVVNCTTPASFFHALRRQMHRNFRKPLIVMTPKSLLRHKLAVSKLSDMAEGTQFMPVLPEQDAAIKAANVRRVIFCSGKVYYDLWEARQKKGITDIAIVRMEQLYPFPVEEVRLELKKYKKAEVMWCQEEHENMGAYHFIARKLQAVMAEVKHENQFLAYAGRAESASPSVGYMKLHLAELEQFLGEAMTASKINKK
ncbi:MAG: 2-oxoglutarate dehydrogenase E1 component [Proteobacteria bacterium]|nr:2-oxoglutarate dehydrogenase E1 component [Pseudomonadota bacterium]